MSYIIFNSPIALYVIILLIINKIDYIYRAKWEQLVQKSSWQLYYIFIMNNIEILFDNCSIVFGMYVSQSFIMIYFGVVIHKLI